MAHTPIANRVGSVVSAIGALAALVALSLRKLADFDLPGHLAVGGLIAAHRGFLHIDELSCTARPVGHVAYISDLFLYATMRYFGPLGLQVMGGFLALTLAAILLRASAGHRGFAIAIAGLVLAAVQPWLLVRPATMSFVLIALLMAELRARPRSLEGRRLYWLVPMFGVWANVHGFVVLGLLLLACYALYACACRLARGRLGGLAPEPDGRNAKVVTIVAALSLLASMCNQAGALLLEAPFRASNDFGHIAEWDTTTLSFVVNETPIVAVFSLVAIVALIFGGDPESSTTARSTPTLFDIGLVLLAVALGRSAVRMLPIAVILTAPIVIRRLGARLPEMSWLDMTYAFSTWLVAPWMLFASPAAAGIGFDPAHFSEGAIDYVNTTNPTGQMYNSLPLGGWLDWRLFPRYRTFVDHRQGWVHSPALLSDYYASESQPQPFADLTSRFDFQWAFVFAAEGSNLGVPIAHSASWAMVYWDDATAVYVRAHGPNAKLASSGYHLMRHLTAPADVLASAIARDQTAKTLALDGNLAEEQAPSSPRAVFLKGCAAIALDDRGSLDEAIAKLARLEPGSAGIALLGRGWEAAESRTKSGSQSAP